MDWFLYDRNPHYERVTPAGGTQIFGFHLFGRAYKWPCMKEETNIVIRIISSGYQKVKCFIF